MSAEGAIENGKLPKKNALQPQAVEGQGFAIEAERFSSPQAWQRLGIASHGLLTWLLGLTSGVECSNAWL